MSADFPIVVMISGRGSNLEALLQAPEAEYYQVVSVVSDNPEAAGLRHAQRRSIPVRAFARACFGSKLEQKAAIYAAVEEAKPRLIVLAGFMQIVEAFFVERHFGRIVNIHPSLLPSLPGLHTHERAIAGRDAHLEHGATVHFVDSGMDTGPIIAQAALKIGATDSAASLAERVLALEHVLYPWAIAAIARGLVTLSAREVRYSAQAQAEADARGFRLLP